MQEKQINNHYQLFKTEDGSNTLFSEQYQEHYHSKFGAYEESLKKFVLPSKVEELARKQEVNILDLCFGLGYNCFTTLEYCNNPYPIQIDTIEMDPQLLTECRKLEYPFESWKSLLLELSEKAYCRYKNGFIYFHLGDARKKILQLTNTYDIVYLDPFSPTKNPELWTYHFIQVIKNKLKPNGIILTYSSALSVLAALKRNGFYLYQTEAVGRKRKGILASNIKNDNLLDIRREDQILLEESKGGIPYRDPKLCESSNQIIARREKLAGYLISKGKIKTINRCKKEILQSASTTGTSAGST